MTFHANGGFHRRAVMNARQDLFGDRGLLFFFVCVIGR